MITTFNFPKEFEIEALNRIKIKLELKDGSKDELLTVLYEDASNMICNYINSNELPKNISWIAEEIAIKRYRKLGTEGMKSEQIDVIKTEFDGNLINEYIPILNKHIKNNSGYVRIF